MDLDKWTHTRKTVSALSTYIVKELDLVSVFSACKIFIAGGVFANAYYDFAFEGSDIDFFLASLEDQKFLEEHIEKTRTETYSYDYVDNDTKKSLYKSTANGLYIAAPSIINQKRRVNFAFPGIWKDKMTIFVPPEEIVMTEDNLPHVFDFYHTMFAASLSSKGEFHELNSTDNAIRCVENKILEMNPRNALTLLRHADHMMDEKNEDDPYQVIANPRRYDKFIARGFTPEPLTEEFFSWVKAKNKDKAVAILHKISGD
jgi:hypothetical protein